RNVSKGFCMAIPISEQNVELGWFEQCAENLAKKSRPHTNFRPHRAAHFRQVKRSTKSLGIGRNTHHAWVISDTQISVEHKEVPAATDHVVPTQKQWPTLPVFQSWKPAVDGRNVEEDMQRCRAT